MHKTLLLLAALAVSPAVYAQAFSTSFETSDGFVSGAALSSVSTWNGAGYSISTLRARTGVQSAAITQTITGNTYGWKDLSPTITSGSWVASVWMWLGSNGANTIKYGLTTWGPGASDPGPYPFIVMNSQGQIFGTTAYGNSTDTQLGTVANPTQRWINVQIRFNNGTTPSVQGVVDGQVFNLGAPAASVVISDFDLSARTTTAAAAEAWFDDMSVAVIPEPATLGLLALVPLALRRRRRS